MSIQVASKIFDLERDTSWMKTSDSQQRLASILLSVPQFRAGWTMAQVDYAAATQANALGTGYPLANNNVATFGADGSAPYCEFDGTNQYLSRADGGAANWADVIGTETYVPAAQQGLTFGGWFYFDRLTNQEFLIGKSTAAAAATSSYWLEFRGDQAGDPFDLNISNGAAITTIRLTRATAPVAGEWYYVVGRFDPSTELKIYVGNGGPLETAANLAAIPAALNDSAADFTIASLSAGGGRWLDGKASCCFLCAGALPDTWITCIYSQFRSIFQV